METYVKNNLILGEEVKYETSYHWIIFNSFRLLFTLFIAPVIDPWRDEFAITNKRGIVKTGLIRRRTVELNLTKIESVNVSQTILGRIVGFGSIQIVGTGGTKESFTNIRKIHRFRKKFQELC